MNVQPADDEPAAALLALYDEALPEVYGYVVGRCRDRSAAEEVTAEVFMAAVTSINRGRVSAVTVPWLIGIARHKVVDHWRRSERDRRRLQAVADDAASTPADGGGADDWDERIGALVAQQVLDGLGAHHRSALVLRYVDGLPVAEVAAVLDRTVHATEALLVRARSAFRRAYEEVAP
ncbi:MAG: sigma-70 family RNA polymerase sigma factor [Acidimicrobiales bacterium]